MDQTTTWNERCTRLDHPRAKVRLQGGRRARSGVDHRCRSRRTVVHCGSLVCQGTAQFTRRLCRNHSEWQGQSETRKLRAPPARNSGVAHPGRSSVRPHGLFAYCISTRPYFLTIIVGNRGYIHHVPERLLHRRRRSPAGHAIRDIAFIRYAHLKSTFYARNTAVDPSLHDLVERILPLATYYTGITSFIEARSHLDFGLVNHALCAAMREMLKVSFLHSPLVLAKLIICYRTTKLC